MEELCKKYSSYEVAMSWMIIYSNPHKTITYIQAKHFPKEHPVPDPGVPLYTVAPVRETEMGTPNSGPPWQDKIDEESLLKRLTREK